MVKFSKKKKKKKNLPRIDTEHGHWVVAKESTVLNCKMPNRENGHLMLKSSEGFLLFSHSVVSNSLPTMWLVALQASLSFTISWHLLKLMFIESVLPSNHLILCRPLPLLPSIFPSIRVFANESALPIRWAKCQHQSFQYNNQ